jgi:transaldolase
LPGEKEVYMSKTRIERLNDFGQSVWLDNINRSLLDTGQIQKLIDIGLRGMTSNPTIFEKAVKSSADYDKEIARLSKSGKTTFEIYDEVTVRDIQDAADALKGVFDKTEGLDGYVSLEVNPKLAYNLEETLKEGERVYKKVDRPNLMLKIPSTREGFKAIEELTASGKNINATLIFSLKQYIAVADAYMRGIKRFIESGGDASNVQSVASVFVSRTDTAADKILEEKNGPEGLRGRAAVANIGLIYSSYKDIFTSGEFKKLQGIGANPQRALWASTSTKNPAYSDIKYVTELIAKETVNTVPPDTFDAFLDHGEAVEALTGETAEAQKTLKQLKDLGIDVDSICEKLLEDGVVAFERSFDSLLQSIEEKTKVLCRT